MLLLISVITFDVVCMKNKLVLHTVKSSGARLNQWFWY